MKTASGFIGALALLGSSGCSNMSRQERDTAIGVGVGAAVGGVVGHEVSK